MAPFPFHGVVQIQAFGAWLDKENLPSSLAPPFGTGCRRPQPGHVVVHSNPKTLNPGQDLEGAHSARGEEAPHRRRAEFLRELERQGALQSLADAEAGRNL